MNPDLQSVPTEPTATDDRNAPVHLIEPQSKQTFVLVRLDAYERLQALAYDDTPWTEEEAALLAAETSDRLDGRIAAGPA